MDKLKILKFIFLIIFFLSAPISLRAVVLYIMPQSQTVFQEESFIVEIRLDTEGKEINTIEGNLKFSSDLLEIIDLSRGGSILSLWVKEPNAKEEKISFIGGKPGGFKGDGLILRMNFLGKKIGEGKITFENDSKVLLNDGKGTPTSLSFLGGNYEIISKPIGLPEISSSTHPNQNKWYNQNTLHLHWDLIEGAKYSFLLSKDSLVEPDEIPDRPKGELQWMGDMEYPNLEDGIYYFSLKQKLPGEEWSETVKFRVMVDTTPPKNLTLRIGNDSSLFNGKHFLSFAASDKTSGIDHYEIIEGEYRKQEKWETATSPYLLKDQNLQSVIRVKAIDKAGNEEIAEIIPPKKPFSYWIVGLSLLGGAVVIWWFRKKSTKRHRNSSTAHP